MPLNDTASPAPQQRRTLWLPHGAAPCPKGAKRRPLQEWRADGVPLGAVMRLDPCQVAAAYRRMFGTEPPRGRGRLQQRRVYSGRELCLISLALEPEVAA